MFALVVTNQKCSVTVTSICLIKQEVALLKATLARKRKADEETVIQLLRDGTELHLSALRGLNFSVEYLQMLDLSFLLRIVHTHLESKQVFYPSE